jgi:Exonuclease
MPRRKKPYVSYKRKNRNTKNEASTRKNSKSGMKEFNLNAEPFYPAGLRINAEEFLPSDNLLRKMEEVSILNEVKNTPPIKPTIEDAVAIDCEMVGVGPYGKKSALAHVAIVDFEGRALYDMYVIPREGINSITNYRTRWSGITRNTLKNLAIEKHTFENVRNRVHKILKNKIIVGHGLINDFKVLEFVPSETNLIWDTTEIPYYKRVGDNGIARPIKLKTLTKIVTGNDIQTNEKEGHSPLEDARASMNLYRIANGYPKVEYKNMSKA